MVIDEKIAKAMTEAIRHHRTKAGFAKAAGIEKAMPKQYLDRYFASSLKGKKTEIREEVWERMYPAIQQWLGDEIKYWPKTKIDEVVAKGEPRREDFLVDPEDLAEMSKEEVRRKQEELDEEYHDAISLWLMCSGKWDEIGKQPRPQSNAIPTGAATARVYGLCQAKGISDFHGDYVPENEWDLPEVPVPADGRQYAGFRVEGDSMAPGYQEGDIVFCDVRAQIENGECAVVKYDDTVVIKRVHLVGKDHILLESDNHAYRPIQIEAKEVSWMLPVIWHNRKRGGGR